MSFYLHYKRTLQPILLVVGLCISGVSSAGLINADFSNGLNNWGGDVIYYDAINDIDNYISDVNFADFTSNVSTIGNSITLNTSADNNNEYWGIYLYQPFMVDINSNQLSLSYQFSADYAYITLLDENFDLLHDFMNDGLSVDLSAYAGSQVALEFGIEDSDLILDDYLTVSNISISQNSVPVPEPSTFVLFSIALLALRQWSTKTNKNALSN